MSRRPTKPQLRRRSGASSPPPASLRPPPGRLSPCLSGDSLLARFRQRILLPSTKAAPRRREGGPTSQGPPRASAPRCSAIPSCRTRTNVSLGSTVVPASRLNIYRKQLLIEHHLPPLRKTHHRNSARLTTGGCRAEHSSNPAVRMEKSLVEGAGRQSQLLWFCEPRKEKLGNCFSIGPCRKGLRPTAGSYAARAAW